MLERTTQRLVNFFAERTLKAHVDKHIEPSVEARIKELMRAKGVFIVYANHQGHADGIALAVMSEYLRQLAAEVDFDLKGFAAPMARSWASGDQNIELKQSYDLLSGAGRKYGLEREMVKELRPFREKLKQGYGIMVLPEGSVEGGSYIKGTKRVKGMQKIDDDSLMLWIKLAGKDVAFQPLALQGSSNIAQKEDGVTKLTRRGKWSLIAGALGIPIGIQKIEATLLMPYTVEEITRHLGDNWMEKSEAFNNHAMRRLNSGLPPDARGYYGRITDDIAQTIAVSAAS
ncbi:hypothetical protein HYU94_02675 [Candidatus Daviesbacteria bacterium]|nr:hypothetical protein [Candidatus Daviesbacteria bacterium]